MSKLVEENFENRVSSCAPSRIRTCAHGSGGESSLQPLPGKTRIGCPAGGHMGGVRGGRMDSAGANRHAGGARDCTRNPAVSTETGAASSYFSAFLDLR